MGKARRLVRFDLESTKSAVRLSAALAAIAAMCGSCCSWQSKGTHRLINKGTTAGLTRQVETCCTGALQVDQWLELQGYCTLICRRLTLLLLPSEGTRTTASRPSWHPRSQDNCRTILTPLDSMKCCRSPQGPRPGYGGMHLTVWLHSNFWSQIIHQRVCAFGSILFYHTNPQMNACRALLAKLR